MGKGGLFHFFAFWKEQMKNQERKHELLWDTEALIAELKAKECISPEAMHYLIRNVALLMKNEPNVLRLTSPLTIVGDIHGQFYDLVQMLSLFGGPGRQWLFLGDFIDRGTFSVQVVTLLLALKLRSPQSVHLLRGNHESRCMTAAFNFRQECLAKHDEPTYDALMQLFDLLPICAVVDGKYFAVHAGISPHCQTLEDIQRLNRFQEVPEKGGLCDLLWSDPSDACLSQWQPNDRRSCSYFFGVKQARGFLTRNGLQLIIRGHEVSSQGFKYQGALAAPLTLTIFSAPNYSQGNKAAVAEISPTGLQIRTFEGVQHPVSLPAFQNLFSWSLPFVANCTDHLFKHLLRLAPTAHDPRLQAILNNWQAFQQDYENMRKTMLIDQVLKQGEHEDHSLEAYPKSSKKKPGKKTLVGVAKVIGPKLDDKLVKIGLLSGESEEQLDALGEA